MDQIKGISSFVNSNYDEEAVGLSSDGQKLLVYIDNLEGFGDIYYSSYKGKGWLKPYPLGATINSKGLETGASISPNGKTLYFSSDRKEGSFGGRDIYMSHILPDGNWGAPVNLGPEINTQYDEDAPFIHVDGNTLYFCSKGHDSMGGYDIFKSFHDDSANTWSKPENIGYPINTADDNLYFSLSVQGKYAYVSALRPEGFGDLDIYKVNFKDVQRNNYQTIIKGIITTSDSSSNIIADVSFVDREKGKVIGHYTPGAANGKFVISATPGTYKIVVESGAYITFEENVDVPEKDQPAFVGCKILLKHK